MREISSRIPDGVRRMTDGETGERGYWINFQTRKFEQMPEFEMVTAGQTYETPSDAPAMPQLRLAEGASAKTIAWPNIGYADAYTDSFQTFDRLQQEGTIAAGVRLQLQYPTASAAMAGTIAVEDLPAVAPSYAQALFADLGALLARLPHGRVAVQWDVAVEFGALEGAMGPQAPIDQIAAGLARCVDSVPADVPVGDLETGAHTELNFALVPYHPEDQAPGTTALQIEDIDAALFASPGGARPWGICTECGMGRVDAGDVPGSWTSTAASSPHDALA